jgi:hypothetical protein
MRRPGRQAEAIIYEEEYQDGSKAGSGRVFGPEQRI